MRLLSSAGRALAGALGAAAALSACGDFLKVTNPGRVEVEALDQRGAEYATLLVNGTIGEFQPTFAALALYSAVFSDELRNHHVFFENRQIDLRNVLPDNGTYATFIYLPLHRSRFFADSAVGRFRATFGDSASGRDVRVARMLAYGGYNYVLLGEQWCESPINGSAPVASDSLLKIALSKFDSAVTIATAYAAGLPAGAAAGTRAAADTVLNFARVGAARAALDLNDKPRALAYARQVTAGFELRAFFAEANARENNPFWGAMAQESGSSKWVSVANTPFSGLVDPRVPLPTTTEAVQDAARVIIPNSPSAFGTYSGTLPGNEPTRASSMRVASHLEAQYIIAEAEGPTSATLAFVNARRAAGQQPAVTLAGDPLMAELREQRRRDLYLDNHRMGDMRRYKRYYGVDEYQTGLYPGSTTESYGTQECWPLTLNELLYNPNVPRG